DATTGKERRRLPTRLDSVTSLAFTPDGKTLAAAQGTRALGKPQNPPNRVQLWETSTGKERSDFEPGTGRCWVAFTPDGQTLVCASEDWKVVLVRTDTGKKRFEFDVTGHRHWFHAIAFSPD